MELPRFLESKGNVMMGKTCFEGTRIPVYIVLEKITAGETRQQILAAYPQLRNEQITAAIQYNAQLTGGAEIPARP